MSGARRRQGRAHRRARGWLLGDLAEHRAAEVRAATPLVFWIRSVITTPGRCAVSSSMLSTVGGRRRYASADCAPDATNWLLERPIYTSWITNVLAGPV